MRKVRHWLIERVLPVWARQTLMEENEALRQEIRQLRTKLSVQKAYIDGLRCGARSHRRIVIDREEVGKE